MSEISALKLTLELIDLLRCHLKCIDGSHPNSGLARFLAEWPSRPFRTRPILPRLLPVLSHLQKIDTGGNDARAEIVEVLNSCAEQLWWGQSYTADDTGEAFLDNYGWTELIGLRGPVASEQIACGFLLLGPNTEYPKHSHEAEEVYLPFTSQTFWIRGEEEWRVRESGNPIYHRPWLAHGMRTGATPLLALYIWRGSNLTQKSRFDWTKKDEEK